MLPGMDGFAGMPRAAAPGGAPADVPVVMLTGLADTPSKLQGFDLGADDYLVKPVPARELAARLRKLIAARADATDARAPPAAPGHRRDRRGRGPRSQQPLAAALGTLDLVLLRQDLPIDIRRDLAQCRAHLWRIASTVAQLTDVRDRTVEYLGPDRMIDLKPEGHA